VKANAWIAIFSFIGNYWRDARCRSGRAATDADTASSLLPAC
jgi:hypothetical protein